MNYNLTLHAVGREFAPNSCQISVLIIFVWSQGFRGSNSIWKWQFSSGNQQLLNLPFCNQFEKLCMLYKGGVPQSAGTWSKNYFSMLLFSKKMKNVKFLQIASWKCKNIFSTIYPYPNRPFEPSWVLSEFKLDEFSYLTSVTYLVYHKVWILKRFWIRICSISLYLTSDQQSWIAKKLCSR